MSWNDVPDIMSRLWLTDVEEEFVALHARLVPFIEAAGFSLVMCRELQTLALVPRTQVERTTGEIAAVTVPLEEVPHA